MDTQRLSRFTHGELAGILGAALQSGRLNHWSPDALAALHRLHDELWDADGADYANDYKRRMQEPTS